MGGVLEVDLVDGVLEVDLVGGSIGTLGDVLASLLIMAGLAEGVRSGVPLLEEAESPFTFKSK